MIWTIDWKCKMIIKVSNTNTRVPELIGMSHHQALHILWMDGFVHISVYLNHRSSQAHKQLCQISKFVAKHHIFSFQKFVCCFCLLILYYLYFQTVHTWEEVRNTHLLGLRHVCSFTCTFLDQLHLKTHFVIEWMQKIECLKNITSIIWRFLSDGNLKFIA